MNTFINFLATVIPLTKLSYLRKFFILYICIFHGTASFKILQLKTSESEVSFFINSLCVFANIYLFLLTSSFCKHLSTSSTQTNCFINTLQKLGKNLHGLALIFLILVIWQINTFCFPVFLSLIFTVIFQWFFKFLQWFFIHLFLYFLL